MRVVTTEEYVSTGSTRTQVTVKRIENVTDLVIKDSFRNILPLEDLRRLLRLKLVQADSYPGSIGIEFDGERRPWQVVPYRGYLGERKMPPDKSSAASSADNVLLAFIVARLMLGLDCILIDDKAARIDDTDANQLDVYRLYRIRNGQKVERDISLLPLGPLVLYGTLRLMSSVEGVKKLRRAVCIDGKFYEQDIDGRIIETHMGKDYLPLFDIATPQPRRAKAILAPLIGQRAFDLLCIAFFYCLVATPRWFFLLSGGRSAIRTMLRAYIRSFRAMATDDVSLYRLKGSGDWATRTQEIRKLIGKSITFIDEIERVNSSVVESIRNLSDGFRATVRYSTGKVSDVYLRSWVFLGSDELIRFMNSDTIEERTAIIRPKKSSDAEWSIKTDDGTGNLVVPLTYACSTDCISDMVSRGLDLVMNIQTKAGSVDDVFRGVLADGVPSVVGPIGGELIQLVERLRNDKAVRAYMNGDSEDGRSYIPVVAQEIIPNMPKRSTFLAEHGIKIRGPKRTFKSEGKQKPVITIVDRDAFRPVWDLVQGDAERDILTNNEELMNLVKRLHNDSAVCAYMSGESEDGRSCIPAVAQEILPSMHNRGSFLTRYGIKVRDSRRFVGGRRQNVITIVDRDAFRPVWNLVDVSEAQDTSIRHVS
ncbi:hypothetical protein EMO89_00290 [Bifidobacterium tissieri]|uniref:Uncharacterized protein n=1 Tax=Bifidobacterium tissieri TaxID=1630162 RepID=A0A5M9ZYQ0_9BIFI|nr:hypothetical protein [Bifidobacterium tissieri]KAA8832002.1 hypothetical protein EMO89_00290 [Bifidobacterium tissieri]